jgi:predicted DNA repair protein MutK
MPFNIYNSNADMRDVVRERSNDALVVSQLEQDKLNGRIRTDFRTVPSSATDVVAGDAEGDIVVDATYIYRLITVSSALKWDRQTINVGW